MMREEFSMVTGSVKLIDFASHRNPEGRGTIFKDAGSLGSILPSVSQGPRLQTVRMILPAVEVMTQVMKF